MTRRASGPPPYRFEDRSVLRPSAVKLYFSRLFQLLPGWLTANFVTIGGFGATLGVAAFAAGAPDASPALLALVYLVGTQLYVVGDHLDGMQAVASRTTSPLGEFLDHFLDVGSGAILVLAGFTLMEGRPPWALPLVLWLYLLAFTVTYVERAERRELHFHRMGSLEGIAIVSVFFATSVFPAGRAFWNGPLVAGLQAWWLIVAVAVATLVGTVAVVLGRMRRVPAGFALYALAAGTAAAAISAAPPALRVPGWLLLSLHGAEYLARVMQPQIFGRDVRPDGIAPAAAVLAGAGWLLGPGAGEPTGWPAALVAVGVLWLTARTAATVGRVLSVLGDHWIWVNPAPDEASGD